MLALIEMLVSVYDGGSFAKESWTDEAQVAQSNIGLTDRTVTLNETIVILQVLCRKYWYMAIPPLSWQVAIIATDPGGELML